jgi:hypothetical protein
VPTAAAGLCSSFNVALHVCDEPLIFDVRLNLIPSPLFIYLKKGIGKSPVRAFQSSRVYVFCPFLADDGTEFFSGLKWIILPYGLRVI